VDGVAGTLVKRDVDSFQVFIPSRTAAVRWLRMRNDPQSAWNWLAEISYVVPDNFLRMSEDDAPRTLWFDYTFEPKGRRDWFRLDDNSWVERYNDGTLTRFDIVGPQTFTTTLRLPFFNTPFSIPRSSGVITRRNGGDFQVYVPDAGSPEQWLRFRANPTSDWQWLDEAKRINPLGTFAVDMTLNLDQVQQAALAQVPNHFDESGHPEANDYRWAFDVIDRQVTLSGGRVVARITYKGDLETRRLFGGCHLKWVYPIATLSFRPDVVQQNGVWIVTAADPQFQVDLRPDSDTQCSIFPISIAGKIRDFLNGDNIRNVALDAVKRAARPVPVDQIWTRLAGPIDLGASSGSRLCFYPDPVVVGIGGITGTLSAAHIPVQVTTRSKLLIAPSCQPPQASSPQITSSVQPGNSFNVSAAIAFPYDKLEQQVLASLSGNAGVSIRSVHMDGGTAYFTITADITNPLADSIELQAFPQLDATGHTVTMLVKPSAATLANRDASGRDLVNSIASAITSACTIDLSHDITTAQQAISGTHDLGGLRLTIVAPSVVPQQVVSGGQGLHIYVQIQGTAAAQM
jgi:hypothetical protein